MSAEKTDTSQNKRDHDHYCLLLLLTWWVAEEAGFRNFGHLLKWFPGGEAPQVQRTLTILPLFF
jgi:hypothetical protein